MKDILLNAFFAIVLEIVSHKDDRSALSEEVADDLEEIELDESEKDLRVPVADTLIALGNATMMPPNYKSDIKSLNIVKSKNRRHAAVERRVRILFEEQEESVTQIDDFGKVTFNELYAEDEETAIEIGSKATLADLDDSKKYVVPEKDLSEIPIARSCFIFHHNNKFRIYCHKIINHSLTKNIILVIIICSSLMLGFYDPLLANTTKSKVLHIFDYVFLGVFILELLINLVAYGILFHPGAFFRKLFNWIDFIVIFTGILDIFVEVQLSALKALRVLRVLKALRSIKQAREMKHVINSLIITIKNIWKIILVMLLLVLMFSIMGVILFKGSFYSCTDTAQKTKIDCMGTYIAYSYDGLYTPLVKNRTWNNHPFNFDNVAQAFFTLFVITTYQGYPELLYITIDSTTENRGPYYNNNRGAFFYYLIYIIIVKFFLLNIFIGYVVLSYQQSRNMEYRSDALDKNQTDPDSFSINIFRLFRVLRLVKLLMRNKSILKILWTFIKSFKTFPWVILLVVIVFYAYAIIGMQFFGQIGLTNENSAININNNFQTLISAVLVLFRCVTGEDWNKVMISCVDPIQSKCIDGSDGCGNAFAYFYFLSFTVITYYLIMNLFLAVIIDNFDYLTKDNSILSPHHLEEFIEKWSEYDVGAKGRLRPLDLVSLLTKINPPLGFGKMCSHEKCMQKLMTLNIPLERDGTVGIHAALFAIIRRNLKIKLPLDVKDSKALDLCNEELRITIKKLWPKTSTALIEKILPNVKDHITVGKFYATFIIQDMFRKWKFRKSEEKMKIISNDNMIENYQNSDSISNESANSIEEISEKLEVVITSKEELKPPSEGYVNQIKNLFMVPGEK